MTASIATDTRIVVFARAPEPGKAKTRLIPLLGTAGAAALQHRLIEHALSTALAANAGAVELCCSPDAGHPLLATYANRDDVILTSQRDGDLGARMLHAARRVLATHARVIMIGTDCPALTAAQLRHAAHALEQGNDAVLIPAEDGGYVLIGLARCDDALFDGIAWGGDQVMSATRDRLRALAWRWHELPPSWDVDRPGDYRRLAASGIIPDLETALSR
jgi:uncharacterized protein